MSKLKFYDSQDKTVQIAYFYCPACKKEHPYHTKGPSAWEWNGEVEKPTFSPSLLVDGHDPEKRCHLFLRNGVIEYCGDCHHEMKGQSVPLPDLPGPCPLCEGEGYVCSACGKSFIEPCCDEAYEDAIKVCPRCGGDGADALIAALNAPTPETP